MKTEEIADRLRQAAEAVQAADLSEDLRQIGFKRALDAVGLGVSLSVPSATSPSASLGSSPPHERGPDQGGPIAEIARRFDLPRDTLERIYEVEEGTVRLAIKRSMLPEPDRKAAAMRDVSLLVIAGRQAAGEEQTALSDVREECQALNVLDAPNFASEVTKLDFRLSGARNRRVAKANRHHFEEAATLIGRILGETS